MSLKGLTKTTTQPHTTQQDNMGHQTDDRAKEAQAFIQAAAARTPNYIPTTPKTKSKVNYIRQTFSLTQEVSDQIDELLVECRVARANRSLIVKAAIRELAKLDGEELNKVVNDLKREMV